MNKPLLPAALAALALAGTAFAAPAAEEAEPKIPTPDTPILMIGDSMMRLLGTAMEKSFRKAKIQPAVAFSSLGSGLVRPAVFDWTAKVDDLIATNHPHTVFVSLGTNDRQPIEGEEGGAILYGKPEWEEAYARRIGAMMDQLIAGGVTRVVWLLLPTMKEQVYQDHAELVNEIIRREAEVETRRDKVTLFDLDSVLTRKPGKFTQYMMSPDGQALSVRDPDGVHLTNEGAKFVSAALLKTYWHK
jgi:hypothetical protein